MIAKMGSAVTPAERQLKFGWIGAGKMGAPMIRNLLAENFSVRVTEPSASQLDALVAAGATAASSLSSHDTSDIVFATLPNDRVLLDVVLGTKEKPGLAATMAKGSSFVEMSTVSPECSERIATAFEKRGVNYLRAPISGSTALAEQRNLTILASGDKAAWDVGLPAFKVMSTRQFYLGEGDEARFMKLVLNTLVGASSALVSEALALGASGGLSRKSMMDVISESAVASPLLKYKADAIVAGDYTPAFTIEQMIKDFSLISDAARSKGVPLFATNLILELYRAAANAGLQEQDFFALVKWHSEMSRQ